MADGYMLSPADYALFKEMARYFRTVVRSRQHDPSNGRNDTEDSEVYVAKTSGSGIPARSGTTAGKLACDIYRIVSDVLEVYPASLQKDVYNLTLAPITALYVPVAKAKNGTWIALESGGTATCVKTIGGVLTTDLSTITPADVTHFLAIDSTGCVRRCPKSGC